MIKSIQNTQVLWQAVFLAASPLTCRLRRQNFISRVLTILPATQANRILAESLYVNEPITFKNTIIVPKQNFKLDKVMDAADLSGNIVISFVWLVFSLNFSLV